ncbi:MAG: hypothetical protein RL684_268 [Pseudomonadota bacterium]|jgi:hypothetical protein
MVEPWLLPSPDDGEGDVDDEDADADEPDDGLVEESLDDESTDDERDPPVWLGVLPGNRVVVDTFQRCQPQISVGMGVLWQGVTASEIRAACVLGHVPRADWPKVLDGVQLMARVVANVRNEEEAKRAAAK